MSDRERFESSVPQAAQSECNAVHPANEDTYCRRKKGHFGNHSAPCFVAHPSGASSIDWSAAPVAQVDAGKYDFAKVRSQHFTEIAEEYEPVVAQTEFPPIPDDLTQYYDDAKRRAAGRLSLEVQLIERIAKSEDREAELKAEIERLKLSQPGTASLYVPKAAYEVLQGKMEALERSHAKLLEAVNEALGCIDPGVYPDTVLELQEVKSAAEKLRPIPIFG